MQLRRALAIIAALNSTRSVSAMSLKKVPQARLGVSEPPPEWFGNPPNVCKESWTNKNWLKSRFHFSFAEYSNPGNQNFGVLRVMNDDLVQEERGFGAHPHRDVEICTYIVNGALTHKDSMGTAETLTRGAVQFMTAGSGVTHSEHNLAKDKPLRFIQIWISTRQRGLKPNYGSALGSVEERTDRFAHLVTDVQNSDAAAPIKINQDANIYVSEISSGKSVEFVVKENRQAYLLCVEGGVKAQSSEGSSETLAQHDAMEIREGPATLTFTPVPTSATDSAHLLIVEMALDMKSGRKDF